jgi:regulator of ribonuclease activity A
MTFTTCAFTTCDLCDANEGKLDDGSLQVLPPLFRHFGKRDKFSGSVLTIKAFEDNVLVRSTLETPGQGRVMVVDGGGSLRCALVGGMLGELAQKNDWAGIIVDGCVRDTQELKQCEVGICALASHPQKSKKKGAGEVGGKVRIAGVVVRTGDWVYVDQDGILISSQPLT